MSVPERIKELIRTFDYNLESYKKGSYNETQVRREFIDPFFEELGWDIANKKGYSEAYKDVIHEDAIKVGGVTKAPDYCFRIGGARKFFLEAKKPSINIQEDIHPAYQLRRYGWSAKLPLSILTDFEELAVYDCRVKPTKTDKVSHSRILYLKYTDYVARWEEIAGIFSRNAILKGSFDKYVESKKGKKGTAEVDTAFLYEIENWRGLLARNIALRNSTLSQRELNFAVQQTIDRIVFLRICEDRGMEPYGGLMALRNGENVYKRLFHLFKKADEKYNSGLFHFKKEKGRENCDNLTPFLQIDDKPLKEIFKNLYYPESPYEFSVLSADILGQVYERFLGKVIRLTVGHQAKIEEKPEVRKAGGVYYTPDYIVDYIVKNTVGKLVEGKKPGPRGGVSHLKILDPACGSGSFLIRAYQFLLNWHRDEYINDGPEKWSKGKIPRIYRSGKGEWRLSTDERKRILLNNIYGVDIDHQAVEVTKLSLLLKVLEGEDEQSIGKQMSLFQQRVLPDLSDNIKCGNSLIGPDFYENQQMNLFDEEEMYRINTFDWEPEFPEIMKKCGFDAVIGNPPYVFGRDWKALGIGNDQKVYLGNRYQSSPYQLDMFSIFMEKAIELSTFNGYVGFIVPNVWLTNTYSSSTRSFILSNSSEVTLTVPPKNVFSGITVDTVVYTLKKNKNPGKQFDIKKFGEQDIVHLATYESKGFLDGKEPISTSQNPDISSLLNKIRKNKKQLGEFAQITRGVHSYRKGGYGKSAFSAGPQTEEDIQKKPYHSQKERKGFRPFIYGKDLKRFTRPNASEYVKYGAWLAEPRKPIFFEGDRIYSRKILGERLVITIEKTNTVADQQVYITKPNITDVPIEYCAAVLGSKMMAFFIRNYFDEGDDAFPQIKVGQLKSLPILLPQNTSKQVLEIKQHINNLLKLNEQLQSIKLETQRQQIHRTIDYSERKIDELVYSLYGLNEGEIKIVESKT